MRSVHSEYEGQGVRRQSRICLFEILKETSNLISELTDSNKELSNHANRIKRETGKLEPKYVENSLFK